MAVPRYLLIGLLVVLALAAPNFIYSVFLMKVLCFALFACAFNLLLGYVGLLSFGHAAFFGFAAYVTGHAVKVWALAPELGILAGVAVAAGLGFLFGGLAIRRQGIYFAMITLALAQMIYFLSLQAPFTGGEDGIQAIPRGRLFGVIDLRDNLARYYFVLLVFVLPLTGLLPEGTQNLRATRTPPAWLGGGTWSHPLGTDKLGRDLLARVFEGDHVDRQ